MELLRLTRSVCPTCLREVEARIVDRGDMVVMEKGCEDHGPVEVLLARDGTAMRELLPLRERLGLGRGGGESYSLYVTPRCHEHCPTCFTNQCLDGYHEPSVFEVRSALKGLSAPRVSVFGGEPTERADLFGIVSAIRDAGGEPVVFTNGLRLVDPAYARELVNAGAREVRLELDTLDPAALARLRGADVLDAKLTALDNLDTLGATAFIEAVVVPGVNERPFGMLVELAARTPCVRGISFRSYAFRGRKKDRRVQPLRPDELIALATETTDGAVTMARVVAFQKVLAAFLRLAGQRWCPADLIYPLVRREEGLVPVHDVADVDALASAVERTAHLWSTYPALATARLSAAAAPHLAGRGAVGLGASALQRVLAALVGRQTSLDSDLVLLSFGAFCDPTVIDLGLMDQCPVRDLLHPGRRAMCASYLAYLQDAPADRNIWKVRGP